jgi:hypothetical protein
MQTRPISSVPMGSSSIVAARGANSGY